MTDQQRVGANGSPSTPTARDKGFDAPSVEVIALANAVVSKRTLPVETIDPSPVVEATTVADEEMSPTEPEVVDPMPPVADLTIVEVKGTSQPIGGVAIVSRPE
ncbi:hypothetical protein GUJ93_ZPchr0012g21091 [Zizania palustris]|uniref:Uncharacterized protein n=1 Tax=Zizania palustris TaxID=103762 RepID=A0A8J5WY20_ZIZPA|nr:hypothetical protein GUJ93_ZPchr0012g21091 [Zizania palustris]